MIQVLYTNWAEAETSFDPKMSPSAPYNPKNPQHYHMEFWGEVEKSFITPKNVPSSPVKNNLSFSYLLTYVQTGRATKRGEL